MNLMPALRKIFAMFQRDLSTARSYRSAFLMDAFQSLFGVAVFYYLSRFIQSPQLSSELPQGSTYFAFALVGFAFFDYLGVAINVFDQSIEDARQNGTLEYLLVTQTSLPVVLIGSMIYPFVLLALRTAIYLGWGVVLFGFPMSQANWLGAIIVLGASVLAFAGLGVLSAAYLLLFKRGNPAKWLFLSVAGLVSGVMYPTTSLPKALQLVAWLVPVTYSLTGMRAAVLGHATVAMLWPSIRALLLFAIVLLPLSFLVFSWALRRTKITGTLTHF
jgi:ABC-2 type transport system permease protein